jgi:diguanylate cyclase (GGDEF)-like protein/PAS domain S-box-containing protein
MTALRTRVEHDQISVDKRVLEARFNYLSKLVNDIMLLIDVGGRILEANERAEEAYGYAHAELLRMNADDLLAPQTVDVFKPETPSAPHRLETLHRRRDGTVFPVEKHERLIELEGRKILQVILRDLTENRRVEAALAASEARYRSLFENMIEGFAYCQMLYLDGVAQDYLVLEVNTSFERLTGLGNVSGRKGSELIAGVPGVAPERLRVYERVATTGQPERFETFVDSLGIWFAVTVYSPGSGYFIMVFDNITDRKDADARIHFLAHHDALTGLPNRMLGRTRFEMARAYSDQSHNKVALLFLDLDNFKTVNDSLGHTLGDKLLMAVAQRLRECVRETDVICRQGGDEFLLVLLDMPDGESIDLLAAKLLKQVAASYRIDGIDLSISASCGVAIYPNDGQDFDTLYKKADAAMYQAKESGRNACRFYDEQMNLGADERLNLGASLRQALELQEFTLYFQPQIDLGSRMIIGAEALIRWNHPQLGLVPPGRFIPVAENSWQIVPICEWVLNEACRQAQWWRLQGLPDLVVAVNLSAVQFRRGTLEQIVAAALRDSGLPSHLLELELTETILIKDTEKALATVRHLKNLGVKLSIDDFGTGYSSLAYLQRFTVDKVKIDQSFIADLTDDPSNVAIVKAIIQMAKSLGLRTIAEGVEVGWMLDYLAINQCDEAQGYHIGAPMPTDRFVDFVKGKWASSNDSAAR